MIPVLYRANATEFTTFGLGALSDAISCEVTEERNGAFELVMKYPTTGQNYNLLANERLVKAKPNDTANDQAFRIYRITTPLNPHQREVQGRCTAAEDLHGRFPDQEEKGQ